MTCRTTDHPNVHRIQGIAVDISPFCIVSEWLTRGNVNSHLKNVKEKSGTRIPYQLVNKWVSTLVSVLGIE